MEGLVGSGWTPLEAIEAATRGAAFAIGREAELGSLHAGKVADITIVHGDPAARISDVRNVEAVFLAGRQVVTGGCATLDIRPVPWPADQVAARTVYRSTAARPTVA
jgi:cytosine/adenosine deaminase-related metal-dependent hydrolase